MMLAFYTLSVIRRRQRRNLTLLCEVYRENNWLEQASTLAAKVPGRDVLKSHS